MSETRLFEHNANFAEVPACHMSPDLWHEVMAVRMTQHEHISLLEGRAVTALLRRKLGASTEFGLKHLHFTDNLSVSLLAAKGRSNNFPMLRIGRRIAALLLATSCHLVVRWCHPS